MEKKEISDWCRPKRRVQFLYGAPQDFGKNMSNSNQQTHSILAGVRALIAAGVSQDAHTIITPDVYSPISPHSMHTVISHEPPSNIRPFNSHNIYTDSGTATISNSTSNPFNIEGKFQNFIPPCDIISSSMSHVRNSYHFLNVFVF